MLSKLTYMMLVWGAANALIYQEGPGGGERSGQVGDRTAQEDETVETNVESWMALGT